MAFQIESFWLAALPYVPNLIFIVLCIIAFILFDHILNKVYHRINKTLGKRYEITVSKHAIDLLIKALLIFLIIINIPGINRTILEIMGYIVAAIVAFSSSTIIANGMSGVLIKLIKPFEIGDMVRIGDFFGEVVEVRLFYVELQTPKMDMVTVPNAELMKGSIKNYSRTPYVVNTKVTLGYDLSRIQCEHLLLTAAKKSGLKNTFVSVTNLGDYSIEYEINGELENCRRLPIVESNLRKTIIDEFHLAKLEILSPAYIAKREVGEKELVIPKITTAIKKVIAKKEKEELAQVKKLEKQLFEQADKIIAAFKRAQKKSASG